MIFRVLFGLTLYIFFLPQAQALICRDLFINSATSKAQPQSIELFSKTEKYLVRNPSTYTDQQTGSIFVATRYLTDNLGHNYIEFTIAKAGEHFSPTLGLNEMGSPTNMVLRSAERLVQSTLEQIVADIVSRTKLTSLSKDMFTELLLSKKEEFNRPINESGQTDGRLIGFKTILYVDAFKLEIREFTNSIDQNFIGMNGQ